MVHSLPSNNLEDNLIALGHLQSHANEYSGAEYKFYKYGYFKYVREDSVFFIDEIYVVPEFRGTPVSSDILAAFQEFMISENIFMYYGRVFKGSKNFDRRLKAFTSWGMSIVSDNDLYSTVSKMIVKEGNTEE